MDNSNQKKFLEEIPATLPVIPTIDVVVFPNMVVPLLILDEKIIKGINLARAQRDSVKLINYNRALYMLEHYSVLQQQSDKGTKS